MSPAPLRPSPRYALLDAGRGVACLMVVVHHASSVLQDDDAVGSPLRAWVADLLYKGNLGVTLFFVISGYCIAASADAHRRQEHPPLTFLRRRVRRIYPPYWASILITLALVVGLDLAGLSWLHQGDHAVGIDPPSALSFSQWVGNVTLTETIREHFGGPERSLFTVVSWSLCYEEQFYFLCFLALVFAPRRLFPILLGLTIGSLGLVIAAKLTHQWYRVYGLFPALWHDFAVGIAVYYRLNRAARAWGRRLLDGALVAMAAVALIVGNEDALVSATFGLLLVFLSPHDRALASSRWLAPLMACGHRSYSIYLIHLPFVGLVALGLVALGLTSYEVRLFLVLPLSAIAGVLAGWALFHTVETRFLNPPLARRPRPELVAAEAAEGPAARVAGTP